jgi:hypothetical protein
VAETGNHRTSVSGVVETTGHERLVTKIEAGSRAPIPCSPPYPPSKARAGKANDCGTVKNLNANKLIHCDLIQLRTAARVRINFIFLQSSPGNAPWEHPAALEPVCSGRSAAPGNTASELAERSFHLQKMLPELDWRSTAESHNRLHFQCRVPAGRACLEPPQQFRSPLSVPTVLAQHIWFVAEHAWPSRWFQRPIPPG